CGLLESKQRAPPVRSHAHDFYVPEAVARFWSGKLLRCGSRQSGCRRVGLLEPEFVQTDTGCWVCPATALAGAVRECIATTDGRSAISPTGRGACLFLHQLYCCGQRRPPDISRVAPNSVQRCDLYQIFVCHSRAARARPVAARVARIFLDPILRTIVLRDL